VVTGAAKAEKGVSAFDGAWGWSWYGWARRGDRYEEGDLRRIKWFAKRDAERLAEKLDRL
jgi:hypothetical protein